MHVCECAHVGTGVWAEVPVQDAGASPRARVCVHSCAPLSVPGRETAGESRPLLSPGRPFPTPAARAGCLRPSTPLTPSSRTFSCSPSFSARTAGLRALLAGHPGNRWPPLPSWHPLSPQRLGTCWRQRDRCRGLGRRGRGREGEDVLACVCLRGVCVGGSSPEAAVSGSSGKPGSEGGI